MPYYQVRVYRDTRYTQTYYVNVATDCPEHAKEMAAEVLEAQLNGKDHELAFGEPKTFGDDDLVDTDYEVEENDVEICYYTEDLFIKK